MFNPYLSCLAFALSALFGALACSVVRSGIRKEKCERRFPKFGYCRSCSETSALDAIGHCGACAWLIKQCDRGRGEQYLAQLDAELSNDTSWRER